MDVADGAARGARRVKRRELQERSAHRAADRIAARYRGRDASRLADYIGGKVHMSVSDSVREAIRESGFSLSELARQTAVNVAVLSRFMRGERSITLETLDRLSLALKMRITVRKRRQR